MGDKDGEPDLNDDDIVVDDGVDVAVDEDPDDDGLADARAEENEAMDARGDDDPEPVDDTDLEDGRQGDEVAAFDGEGEETGAGEDDKDDYEDDQPPPVNETALAAAGGAVAGAAAGGALASREYDEEEGQGAAEDEKKDKAEVEGPIMGGKGTYEEQAQKEQRNRRLLILATIVAILLLIIILAVIYTVQNPLRSDIPPQVQEGPTTAPTAFGGPTSVPTLEPTADGVTPAPVPDTAAPVPTPTTSSPTFPPFDQEFSRLPCEEIRQEENVTAGNQGDENFELYELANGVTICGDAFAGYNPDKPNRNFWNAGVGRRDCVERDYDEGTEVCLNVGARRCTAEELANGAAQGTGCGGDRTFLYSSTRCTAGNEEGRYMVNLDLPKDFRDPQFECVTDLSRPSLIRCCGDEELPGLL